MYLFIEAQEVVLPLDSWRNLYYSFTRRVVPYIIDCTNITEVVPYIDRGTTHIVTPI